MKGTTEVLLGDRPVVLRLSDVKAYDTRVQVWDSDFRYTLRKYLPLNQHNYDKFLSAEGVAEKCRLLESVLIGNILSFAKGVDIHIDGTIAVTITQLEEPLLYEYKGVKMMGFDLEFKTNISLPDYIGLGKGASLGFGKIKRIIK